MHKEVDLRNYFRLLRQRAWLLVAITAVTALAAYAVNTRRPPLYKASTTLLIEETSGLDINNDMQSIMVSERRGRTYAQILVTRPLLLKVNDKLKLNLSYQDLRDAFAITPIRETQLLKVEARANNADLAALMANTLVDTFVEQMTSLESSRFAASKQNLQDQLTLLENEIKKLESSLMVGSEALADQIARTQQEERLAQYRQNYSNLLQSYEQIRLTELQSSSGIVQIEPATAPPFPASPNVPLDTALGALAALLLTIVVIFVREALDDTIKNPEELSEQIELPMLGLIGHIGDTKRSRGDAKRSRMVVINQPRSPVAEAFRTLRTNIQFSAVDTPIRTLLITSATPRDGKSTVVANLAAVLAQGGQQVALIDADMRRPSLHTCLGINNGVGLSDLFVQPRHFYTLRGTSIDGVSILTAGTPPPNPAELLASEKMGDILNDIQAQADIVLVDTPPITPVTDAVVLAKRVDAVLFVVRAGETRIDRCKRAMEQLGRAGVRVIGVVMNDTPSGSRFYGYNPGVVDDSAANLLDAQTASRRRRRALLTIQDWLQTKVRD